MTEWREAGTRIPGWTALVNTNTNARKYKSPSGDTVGPWAYKSALNQYEKTGVAPQQPLGTSWKKHIKNNGGLSSSDSSMNNEDAFELNIPGSDESISIDLPEPKTSSSSRRRSGLFTSKELSTGTQGILIIATSLIAIAVSLPEAQMTELETKAISIPLGNIFERSKYNNAIGQIIVDKSDWLNLGYALYMYTDRVASAARERRVNVKSPSNVSKLTQSGNGRTEQPAENSGVYLRTSPTGLRNFTR